MVAASLAKAEVEIDRLQRHIMTATQELFETKKARDELEMQLVVRAEHEKGQDQQAGANGKGGVPESGIATAAVHQLMER